MGAFFVWRIELKESPDESGLEQGFSPSMASQRPGGPGVHLQPVDTARGGVE